MRKPGPLRNRGSLKGLDLPPTRAKIRAKLRADGDADRQFVKILAQRQTMAWPLSKRPAPRRYSSPQQMTMWSSPSAATCRSQAQPHPGRRNRRRQSPSRYHDRRQSYPNQGLWPLQPRRSGQPARTGEGRRPQRTSCRGRQGHDLRPPLRHRRDGDESWLFRIERDRHITRVRPTDTRCAPCRATKTAAPIRLRLFFRMQRPAFSLASSLRNHLISARLGFICPSPE